uniref:Uncharacterized protein n=1 Tax=Brassica oleracea TaxID=3712 RepID=A0A3P6F2X5_BRAOL|nr:unnamed protein product [Brassica oleracea]
MFCCSAWFGQVFSVDYRLFVLVSEVYRNTHLFGPVFRVNLRDEPYSETFNKDWRSVHPRQEIEEAFPKLQETQIYALSRLGESAVSRVSVNSPRETGTVSCLDILYKFLGLSNRRPQINWDSTGEGLSVSVSPEKRRVGMTRRCCWLMWTGCTPQ